MGYRPGLDVKHQQGLRTALHPWPKSNLETQAELAVEVEGTAMRECPTSVKCLYYILCMLHDRLSFPWQALMALSPFERVVGPSAVVSALQRQSPQSEAQMSAKAAADSLAFKKAPRNCEDLRTRIIGETKLTFYSGVQ